MSTSRQPTDCNRNHVARSAAETIGFDRARRDSIDSVLSVESFIA